MFPILARGILLPRLLSECFPYVHVVDTMIIPRVRILLRLFESVCSTLPDDPKRNL